MIIAALSEKLNLFGLKVQKGQSGLITTTLMYLFEMKLITQIVLFGEVQHFWEAGIDMDSLSPVQEAGQLALLNIFARLSRLSIHLLLWPYGSLSPRTMSQVFLPLAHHFSDVTDMRLLTYKFT